MSMAANEIDALSARSYELMLIHENEAYEFAKTDEERRIHEARLKDIIKSYNEFKSTENAEEKACIEYDKIEAQRKENKKSRIFDGVKTVFITGVGLLGTLLGIKASRDNMKVLSEFEREHYIATVGERKAVESAIDVTGMVRKIESGFKK